MSMEFLMGVPGKLKNLLDRLTSTRAGYLDNLPRLDTNIASRAPANTALDNNIWHSTRAGKLDNLDAAVSSRLSSAVKRVLYVDSTVVIPAASDLAVYSDHTIPSVDTSKTLVLLRQSGSGQVGGATGAYNEATNYVNLVNSTTVRASVDPVTNHPSVSRTFNVRWVLVEFN